MKHLFLFVMLTLIVLSGCNKLKDKTLNTNPYDKDYAGPKVVSIAGISTFVVGATHRNRLKILISTQLYNRVLIYRNGVLISNSGRTRYGNTLQETIDDNSSVIGATYYYQAKLGFESGTTSFSDEVNYTTP